MYESSSIFIYNQATVVSRYRLKGEQSNINGQVAPRKGDDKLDDGCSWSIFMCHLQPYQLLSAETQDHG